jgi:peptidylprolyl isomerase
MKHVAVVVLSMVALSGCPKQNAPAPEEKRPATAVATPPPVQQALPAPSVPETPTDLKDPQGATATASGLKSRVLTAGKGGPSPAPTDKVTVHYSGWLEDGTMFDSSVKRGMPATFPLNGVIKGWTEGVGLMTVGEKRRFWIPFELAYGESGRPPVIPPKATLVFDVELIKIN